MNLSKLLLTLTRTPFEVQLRNCHNALGIHNLIRRDTPERFSVTSITTDSQEQAISLIKKHYLADHVLVKAKFMNLNEDKAFDEYLLGLLKQGNSLCAKDEDGSIAGLCFNFASNPVDPKNLRHFAFYRQNPDTKDFLYFTAKLQETPNLWEIFKQPKVFEMKMLAVLPEYRRQGVAAMLAAKSRDLAWDQGYKVVRMDCINPYDYKIAERLMMRCIVKFSLHRLRGPNAPFIRKNSKHNRRVRVYVDITSITNPIDIKGQDFDSMIE